MKLKIFAALMFGLWIGGIAVIGISPSKFGLVAKKKSEDVQIEDKSTDENKRPARTKFAINSVEANQILLLTERARIAHQ